MAARVRVFWVRERGEGGGALYRVERRSSRCACQARRVCGVGLRGASGSVGRAQREEEARLKNGADKWTRGVGERKEKAGAGWAGRRKWACGD